MSPSDHDLLRAYARDGSQSAFAALVERHLNLVYSAARRQVRSPQLAEDVAQSVFIDLAGHAATLPPVTPLAAWLHLVTRRTAIDVIRHESRRAAREHEATALMKDDSAATNWSAVEPLLDEAVQSLDAPDRTAILLRYFQNKSLREVGAALGTSDDAAQKRVSRAVEQLRDFFLRRGVTVTAAGLATDLSAHAIEAAPAGLGAAIAASPLPTATAAAVAPSLTNTITVTLMQKITATGALVLLVGAGIYQANAAYRERADTQRLLQHSNTLAAEARSLHAERDQAASRLAAVEKQIDGRLAKPTAPASGTDAAMEAQAMTWLTNLNRMKALLTERPSLGIPELQLLRDQDWFGVVAEGVKLDTDADIRRAFQYLRTAAVGLAVPKIRAALNGYVKAHDGALPDEPRQLLPHFDPPVDAAILDRYQMLQTGKVSAISDRISDSGLMREKATADVEYDAFWTFGMGGFNRLAAMTHNVSEGQKAFAKANGGQQATTAEQLTAYLPWPVERHALEAHLKRQLAPAGGAR